MPLSFHKRDVKGRMHQVKLLAVAVAMARVEAACIGCSQFSPIKRKWGYPLRVMKEGGRDV